MAWYVYYVWGRYEESLSNYQSLLKYYDSVNDAEMRARVLNNVALIHNDRGDCEQAMELYKRELGNRKTDKRSEMDVTYLE